MLTRIIVLKQVDSVVAKIDCSDIVEMCKKHSHVPLCIIDKYPADTPKFKTSLALKSATAILFQGHHHNLLGFLVSLNRSDSIRAWRKGRKKISIC